MDGTGDLGDHIPCPAHHDKIAGTDILAVDFILIVQCGIGHRHATDKYRLQTCHGCQRPGAANLDINRQ